MSLHNYLGACHNLAEELRGSLQDAEIDSLHLALSGKRVIDWIRWRTDNEALVSEFVAATPKERLTKKKFQEQRLYLTMAGVQHCLEAQALLRVIENNFLVPGGSYRSMAALAGLAFAELYDHEITYWPFSRNKTPFTDDEPPTEA